MLNFLNVYKNKERYDDFTNGLYKSLIMLASLLPAMILTAAVFISIFPVAGIVLLVILGAVFVSGVVYTIVLACQGKNFIPMALASLLVLSLGFVVKFSNSFVFSDFGIILLGVVLPLAVFGTIIFNSLTTSTNENLEGSE